MDTTEKYFKFIQNYNTKLKEKSTDWLGSTDLGEVLLQTAQQNYEMEHDEA